MPLNKTALYYFFKQQYCFAFIEIFTIKYFRFSYFELLDCDQGLDASKYLMLD